MNFARPAALILLAVPVVLLWLRLRARRPRAAEASSLLVWRKVSESETLAHRPRPPVAAWIEAAGAAVVVLGLADPGSPGGARGEVMVVLDDSPSMRARGPDGRTREEFALARARDAGAGHNVARNDDPAVLAPILVEGGKTVVAVTDHRLPDCPDQPRLQVVGVGVSCRNAGITAAERRPLPDGGWRALVKIEVHGVRGPVGAVLHIGEERRTVTLAPEGAVDVVFERRPAATAGEEVEIRLDVEGDAYAGDDVARLVLPARLPFVARIADRKDLDPFVRALEACGVRCQRSAASDLPDVVLPEPERADGSGAGRADVVALEFPDAADGEEVRGATVVASSHPAFRDVDIDPTSVLGRRGGPVPAGSPVLSDDRGALVTVHTPVAGRPAGATLRFAFVPGGTWVERDPSFVVLARNLVAPAMEGSGGIRPGAVLNSKETREAAHGETFGDLARAIAEARRPDPSERKSLAGELLAAAAALIALAWFLQR